MANPPDLKRVARLRERAYENLRAIRKRADGLGRDRLPPWLTAASIRIAWIGQHWISVIEDAASADGRPAIDSIGIRGPVSCDLPHILSLQDFDPAGVVVPLAEKPEVMIANWIDPPGHPTPPKTFQMIFSGPNAWLSYPPSPGPYLILDATVSFHSPPPDDLPLFTRICRSINYWGRMDDGPSDSVDEWFVERTVEYLSRIHSSKLGDVYESLQARIRAVQVNKDRTVIVLGKDSGPELEDLRLIQRGLIAQGYDALLIKDLPEVAQCSNLDKVRIWASGARFCVMLDSVAAGHIAEYEPLASGNVILALLRKHGSGSTYMIGDAEVTSKGVRTFHYDRSPLEPIPAVTQWAELIVVERERGYAALYPWRPHAVK